MSRRNFQGRFFSPSCRWKYKNVCVLVGHVLQRHTERDEVVVFGGVGGGGGFYLKEREKKLELCWKPRNEEATASVQTSITNRDLF